MQVDARLLADIKKSEGCKLVAYKDTRGFWTIGYGHLLDQSVDWTGHEISQAVADQLLAKDLDEAAAQCELLLEWPVLNDCRRNAIIELVFNMGAEHWLGFTMTRAALHDERWQQAHDGLLASQWARQVGPIRSRRLANYLLTGTYP